MDIIKVGNYLGKKSRKIRAKCEHCGTIVKLSYQDCPNYWDKEIIKWDCPVCDKRNWKEKTFYVIKNKFSGILDWFNKHEIVSGFTFVSIVIISVFIFAWFIITLCHNPNGNKYYIKFTDSENQVQRVYADEYEIEDNVLYFTFANGKESSYVNGKVLEVKEIEE